MLPKKWFLTLLLLSIGYPVSFLPHCEVHNSGSYSTHPVFRVIYDGLDNFFVWLCLYSTALLSSFFVPLPTGAFWHCFASSTAVSSQQFYHIGQLPRVFSSQWMFTHFLHDIDSIVQSSLEQSAFCHASWWL